jgi:hypothetical protein
MSKASTAVLPGERTDVRSSWLPLPRDSTRTSFSEGHPVISLLVTKPNAGRARSQHERLLDGVPNRVVRADSFQETPISIEVHVEPVVHRDQAERQ